MGFYTQNAMAGGVMQEIKLFAVSNSSLPLICHMIKVIYRQTFFSLFQKSPILDSI